MKNTLIIFLLAAAFCSCGGSNTQQQAATEDLMQKAEKTAEQFYNYLKNNNAEATTEMTDSVLQASVSRDAWVQMFHVREKAGALQSFKKTKAQTKESEGNTLYTLEYEAMFGTEKYYEELILVKRGEQFKIIHYGFDTEPLEVARRNKDEVKMAAEQFYLMIKKGNHDGVIAMLDEEALKANTAQEWLALLKQHDQMLGAIRQHEYLNMVSRKTEGTVVYKAQYKARYDKKEMVLEEFIFIKRGNGYKLATFLFEPK